MLVIAELGALWVSAPPTLQKPVYNYTCGFKKGTKEECRGPGVCDNVILSFVQLNYLDFRVRRTGLLCDTLQ
jgi:hypothetical protein